MTQGVFSRRLSNRITRIVFAAMFVGSAVLAATAAGAAQLTLTWVDNAGGTANFKVERKTETTGTYVLIAMTGLGITTYVDSTVIVDTTYCYRVKASNAFGRLGLLQRSLRILRRRPGHDRGQGRHRLRHSGQHPRRNQLRWRLRRKLRRGQHRHPDGDSRQRLVLQRLERRWLRRHRPVCHRGQRAGDRDRDVFQQLGGPGSADLAFTGQTRDRVGQGNGARAPDGALDGTFVLTLAPSSGARTVTQLELRRTGASGVWDTEPTSSFWVLGVATSLDGPLLNTSSDAVTFPLAPGGTAVLFAADTAGLFAPGSHSP